jgi:hypothetical protein
MAISNDLLSSTLFSIRDSEVDELYKKVAFLDGVRKAGGVETESGGIKIQRPLSNPRAQHHYTACNWIRARFSRSK